MNEAGPRSARKTIVPISVERGLLLAWIGSAALVTALRFLSAGSLSYDLTLQTQAAQHLMAGKGLTVYRHVDVDLARPAELAILTHFPAGYSLFAAGLMSIGASVGLVAKLLGAAGTMLGWWGWAILVRSFRDADAPRTRFGTWACLLGVISTPLLFTPSWSGTDIVLWAAVPWVLRWLVLAAEQHGAGSKLLDGIAGGVCGLCILVRYASLFLAVYAAGVILWQTRLRISSLTRRWCYFGLGLLPALAVQAYVNHLSKTTVRPGGLRWAGHDLGFVVERVWEGLLLLSSANYMWVFWMPSKVVELFTEARGSLPWQLGLLAAIFLLLVGWVATYERGFWEASRDSKIVAAGLLIAFPLLLVGCMTLGIYEYVSDPRYYWPIVPLSIFIVYALAYPTHAVTRSRWNKLLQTGALIYLGLYLATCAATIASMFVPGYRGAIYRARVIGSAEHWPSMNLFEEFSPARALVNQLLRDQTDALLVTSKAAWFAADPNVDRSRLVRLRCASVRAEYVSGPVHIVILTIDRGGPARELLSRNEPSQEPRTRRIQPEHCFEQLPDIRLVRRFPEERLKVLEARVPAGTRVILRPLSSSLKGEAARERR